MDRELRVPLVTRWDFLGIGFITLFGIAGMLSPIYAEKTGPVLTVFVLLTYGTFVVLSSAALRYAWTNRGKWLSLDNESVRLERADGTREWDLLWTDYRGIRRLSKRSVAGMLHSGYALEVLNQASEVVGIVAVHRGAELHGNADRHAFFRELKRRSSIPEEVPKPIVPKVRRTPLRCWVLVIFGFTLAIPSGVLMGIEAANAHEYTDWFRPGLKPHHYMLLLSIPMFVGLGLITAGAMGFQYLKHPQGFVVKPKSPEDLAFDDFLIDTGYRPQPVGLAEGRTYGYRFANRLVTELNTGRAVSWFIVLAGGPISLAMLLFALSDWRTSPIGGIGFLMFGSMTYYGALQLFNYRKLNGTLSDRITVRGGQLEVTHGDETSRFPIDSEKQFRYLLIGYGLGGAIDRFVSDSRTYWLDPRYLVELPHD